MLVVGISATVLGGLAYWVIIRTAPAGGGPAYVDLGLCAVFLAAMLAAFAWSQRAPAQSGALSQLILGLGLLGFLAGLALGLPLAPQTFEAFIPSLKAALVLAAASLTLAGAIKFRRIYVETRVPDSDAVFGANVDTLTRMLSVNGRNALQSASVLQNEIRQLAQEIREDNASLRYAVSGAAGVPLSEEFRSFGQVMAERHSAAFVEALETVVRDFNTQVNAQFGENFGHLNEAIGRQLEWQENHRDAMSKLEIQMKAASEEMAAMAASHAEIAGKSMEMVHAAESLNQLLGAQSDLRQGLQEHLAAFADVSEKAQSALPAIEQILLELTGGFSRHVDSALARGASALEDQQARFSVISAAVDSLSARTEEAVLNSVETMQQQMTGMLESTTKLIADATDSSAQGLRSREEVEQQLSRLAEVVQSAQPALQGIEEKVASLTAGVASQLDSALARHTTILESQYEVSVSLFKGIDALLTQTKEVIERSLQRAEEEFSGVSKAVDQAVGEVAQSHAQSMRHSEEQLSQLVQTTEKRVADHAQSSLFQLQEQEKTFKGALDEVSQRLGTMLDETQAEMKRKTNDMIGQFVGELRRVRMADKMNAATRPDQPPVPPHPAAGKHGLSEAASSALRLSRLTLGKPGARPHHAPSADLAGESAKDPGD